MSWYKIFILLLCVLSEPFPSLFAQETVTAVSVSKTPKEIQTTIRGHINNAFQDRKAELRFYTDLISFDEHLFQIPLGSDHLFAMTFLLAKPTVATFTYYGLEIQIYIEPGDDLQINFDALDFWGTIKFLGIGAVHNMYLLSSNNKFRQWNSRSMGYEIAQRKAMDYRRLMDRLRDQKYDFLNAFGGKSEFSADFSEYAKSDINYWWAYQLLRYRIEHPLANGLASPMILQKDYYLFLNYILVSNDKALNNRNYLYFLDQYLSFRNDNPPEFNGPAFFTNTIEITSASMLVLMEPDKPPILTELTKGQRVIYLEKRSDFKSKILIEDALHEDYWYKIRTSDGIEGWVIGVGSKLDDLKGGGLKVAESGKTVVRNADKLLKGKALNYIIASNLYWRSHIEKLEVLTPEVEAFFAENTDPVFRDIIVAAYAEAKKRAENKKEVVYGSTNYLTVRRPQILSSEGELVKKVEPIIPVEEMEFTDLPIEAKDGENHLLATKQKKQKKQNRRKKPKKEKEVRVKKPNKKASDKIVADKKKKKKEKEILAKKEGVILSETVTPDENTIVESQVPEVVVEPEKRLNPPVVVNPPVKNSQQYVEIDAQAVLENLQSKKIKIKGSSVFSRGLKLVILEDPILLTEKEVKLSGSNASTMEGTVSFDGEKNAYLEYGQKRIDLYFQNAGDIQVTFNPSDFPVSVKFSGEGAVENNYLLALAQLKQVSQELLKRKIKEAEPSEFKAFMVDQRNEQLAFLETYKKKNKIDRLFQEYAKADIDYWFGYQLLNYPWEHPLYKNEEAPMAVPADYYSFFETFIISNEFALPNLNYVYFLDQFMDYQSNLKSNESFSDKALANKFLNGDPLSYYLAKLLSTDCKRGKALEVGPEIQSFIAQCPNQSYNNVLRQVYNEAKGLSTGDKAPLFTLKDINGNEVRLGDFAGKVIYLDFWATWCSPCVMQMRNSKQWKSEFANRDDMVFIYVSLDKDNYAWKNFVRSQGLGGQHFKADGGDVYKSKIARLYKVKRMPHVYLIDKQGRVAYNSATDSKSGRVVDFIRNLLRD